MSRHLATTLMLSMLALTGCRDLTFHSVCETTPNDPRCLDDVSSETGVDADSGDSSIESGDVAEVGDVASETDTGCTGECKPSNTEVVSGGSCTGAFEELRRECGATCV